MLSCAQTNTRGDWFEVLNKLAVCDVLLAYRKIMSEIHVLNNSSNGIDNETQERCRKEFAYTN